jgi:hypothetical protein
MTQVSLVTKNILFYQGSSYELPFVFVEDGEPVDITNCTVLTNFYDFLGIELPLTFSVELVSAVDGEVIFSLTDEQINNLTTSYGFYSIRLEKLNGDVAFYQRGRFRAAFIGAGLVPDDIYEKIVEFLDEFAAGGGNELTNLSVVRDENTLTILNSVGADAVIPAADPTPGNEQAGLLTGLKAARYDQASTLVTNGDIDLGTADSLAGWSVARVWRAARAAVTWTTISGIPTEVANSSSYGRSFLTAASAAAARTLLGLTAAATATNTDGITEGSTNLFFTALRARAEVTWANLSGIPSWITSSTTFGRNFLGAANAAAGRTQLGLTPTATAANTDSITEGSTRLYFTNARALAAVTWSTLSGIPAWITNSVSYGQSLVAAANAAAARTILGLGNSAVLNTGRTAGTVALGSDTRFFTIESPTKPVGAPVGQRWLAPSGITYELIDNDGDPTWVQLSGPISTPIATVAITNDYNDLTNKPTASLGQTKTTLTTVNNGTENLLVVDASAGTRRIYEVTISGTQPFKLRVDNLPEDPFWWEAEIILRVVNVPPTFEFIGAFTKVDILGSTLVDNPIGAGLTTGLFLTKQSETAYTAQFTAARLSL